MTIGSRSRAASAAPDACASDQPANPLWAASSVTQAESPTAPTALPPAGFRRPGLGLLLGALMLCVVELWLHTDGFLFRFRSAFAAGRAMDKVLFVEANRPELLILGNSRADNAFDPRTVRRALDLPIERDAFNMGIPGADTRVLAGILDRLDEAGLLGKGGVQFLVLTLDETLVQSVDTLGQEVFLASALHMWRDGQYHDAFRASFRLYGYSSNLRQLREPAILARFVRATYSEVEPVGGGAAAHLGYRAGFGGLQDGQSVRLQEAGSLKPPDPTNVRHLWRLLDLLSARGVRVTVVFPPLLNRDVLYIAEPRQESLPYLAISDELRRREIPMLALDAGPPRDPAEFVNAGHLNDRGAQRYSVLLGKALARAWAPSSPGVKSGRTQVGDS